MKIIEVDDQLYQFIASKTEKIGEEASDILRRLLGFEPLTTKNAVTEPSQDSKAVKGEPEANASEKSRCNDNKDVVIVDIKKEQSTPTPVHDRVVLNASLASLELSQLANQQTAVSRFLYILAALQQYHGTGFDGVLEIRGRGRLYFAKSEEELVESGSSTNPKQIGQSGYWVVTNSNTTRKKRMLADAAILLGYNEQDIAALTDKI